MIDTIQKGDTVIHRCGAHHPRRLHVDPATLTLAVATVEAAHE
jgi:hypothetical protein